MYLGIRKIETQRSTKILREDTIESLSFSLFLSLSHRIEIRERSLFESVKASLSPSSGKRRRAWKRNGTAELRKSQSSLFECLTRNLGVKSVGGTRDSCFTCERAMHEA